MIRPATPPAVIAERTHAGTELVNEPFGFDLFCLSQVISTSYRRAEGVELRSGGLID